MRLMNSIMRMATNLNANFAQEQYSEFQLESGQAVYYQTQNNGSK